MKKVLAIILAALMLLSIVACENEPAEVVEDEAVKLTLWTWTSDLELYANKYTQETGVEVEVVYTADTNDLLTKYQTALGAQSSEVDIMVGEADMLKTYFEAGWCADLSEFAEEGQFDQIVDFVIQAGTDNDGVVRAVSYQATPGGIVYRRDIAEEVFGVREPEEVHELFKDFPTMLETAKALKETGKYVIFNDTADLGQFDDMNTSWIGADGKVELTDARLAYMDTAYAFYNEGLIAFNSAWSSTWYAAMGGPIPATISSYAADGSIWSLDVESEEYAQILEEAGTIEVFAYAFPTWGAIFLNTYAGDTAGEWGICEGPCAYVWGGTWMAISEFSEKKEATWDFIEFCCFNEDTADWWIDLQGDFVSLKSSIEKHSNDEMDMFDGQVTYAMWNQIASQVDYDVYSIYDRDITQFWDGAVSNYNTGTLTKEEAIADFWLQVSTMYPDIVPEGVLA